MLSRDKFVFHFPPSSGKCQFAEWNDVFSDIMSLFLEINCKDMVRLLTMVCS